MNILTTRWTNQAALGKTLQEYPRPMMVRNEWICLNGIWDYIITDTRITPADFEDPDSFPFQGQIRVPFSPEAPLSGVMRQLKPDETLWYSLTFLLPWDTINETTDCLLLHFGAVDQICTVYVNGHHAGYHKGGYLPFTLDITKAAARSQRLHLLVSMRDFSDTSYHSRGKQKLTPGGMFYTAQSGIWQTVWLEKVAADHIKSLKLTPNLDHQSLSLKVQVSSSDCRQEALCQIYAPCLLTEQGVTEKACQELLFEGSIVPGKTACIPVKDPIPWTSDSPLLYPVRISFGQDQIYTYFAMRKLDIQLDKKGIPRFCLNDHPVFQTGVLDQGYWPDGLYTAPSDQALIYDIQTMKELGFNMLRKHGKIEADRWYFHCDRMGMLVWQDMVNGGNTYQSWFVTYLATLMNYLRIPVKDHCRFLFSRKSYEGRQEFIQETRQTIQALYNHPSIVCWVPFNEGWGQFSTKKISDMIRKLDPSRLVDPASGWFDQNCGDIKSIHYYFFGLPLPRKESRVMALSEFGGYSFRISGHSAYNKVYGYKKFNSQKALTSGIKALFLNTLLPAVPKGISASVYTQLSDVEEEVNGILTYDREMIKPVPHTIKSLNHRLKSQIQDQAF